jgi:hypothetical protein
MSTAFSQHIGMLHMTIRTLRCSWEIIFTTRQRPIVRKHVDGVISKTLENYRSRYTQYQLDSDLQRFRAEVPALVTWDDHEVENDYGDKWSTTIHGPRAILETTPHAISGIMMIRGTGAVRRNEQPYAPNLSDNPRLFSRFYPASMRLCHLRVDGFFVSWQSSALNRELPTKCKYRRRP